MTDTAVGASTCASGSHVWKGTEGILTMNPKNRSAKTAAWNPVEVMGISATMFPKSKFATPVMSRLIQPIAKIPMSMTRDATWV